MARSLLKAMEEFELRKCENEIFKQSKRTYGSKRSGRKIPYLLRFLIICDVVLSFSFYSSDAMFSMWENDSGCSDEVSP
jgi:hypothetical protein